MTNNFVCIAIVLAVTIALQLFVLRRLRFDWVAIAIVLAGTALRVDYLSYTSIVERNYDGPSHLEYIQAIVAHGRVPDARACGVCGHPPLYYALGALWFKVLSAVGWPLPELGLQWLSLLLDFGYVVFALLILRSRLGKSASLHLAAALVVFWPSAVIHSVRVHNDALASCLMLASVYFIAEWDVRGRTRDFDAALSLSALSLFAKSSGYAVAATLVFVAALRVHSGGQAQRGKSVAKVALAALGLALAAFLAVGLHQHGDKASLCEAVLGSACAGRYVPLAPDTWGHFLGFDVSRFVGSIEVIPADPVLNRFLKSTLFGVMPLGVEFESAYREILGRSISLLFLSMLALALVSLPLVRRENLRRDRAYLAAAVIMLAFLLAFRVALPNEFHEDFRHIYAALVPGCLGYVLSVERFQRVSKLSSRMGVALGLGMMGLSIAFFLRLP